MLYIVSTPIGNLEDITLRAVRTLKEVDIIAAEDTRHTRILLDKYEIPTRVLSYHSHSSPHKLEKIIDLLTEGKEPPQMTLIPGVIVTKDDYMNYDWKF